MFLILQAMIEVNRLTQTFVGNVEGNLAPPIKEAQRALSDLVTLDKDSPLNHENHFSQN